MLSPDRIVETDGLGADLMPVVCAWCSADLGAKAWGRPVLPGESTHGICPKCKDKVLGEARATPPAPVCTAAPPATATFTAPLFWNVMGTDFGRSIAWARQQPNEMTRQIRAGIARRTR